MNKLIESFKKSKSSLILVILYNFEECDDINKVNNITIISLKLYKLNFPIQKI